MTSTPPPLPPAPPAIAAPTPAIEISRDDAHGRFTIAYDPGPIILYAPGVRPEDATLAPLGKREFSYTVQVPAACIVGVRSFIGWDAGSIGEATIEVIVDGFRVYERSDHKELPAYYNAWEERGAHFSPLAVHRPLIVNFVFSAEMLAPRTVDGGMSTRAHGAFRLVMSRTCSD